MMGLSAGRLRPLFGTIIRNRVLKTSEINLFLMDVEPWVAGQWMWFAQNRAYYTYLSGAQNFVSVILIELLGFLIDYYAFVISETHLFISLLQHIFVVGVTVFGCLNCLSHVLWIYTFFNCRKTNKNSDFNLDISHSRYGNIRCDCEVLKRQIEKVNLSA